MEWFSRLFDRLETQTRARTAELAAVNESLRQELEERRRIEDELRQSENNLREATEHLERVKEHLEERVRERTAELEEVNTALLRSNRELQEFAYVASHDLQEPLRKIQAFGDRLLGRCKDQVDERGQEYITRMQASAARMQRLINDLLAFSRVTTHAQPFDRVELQAVARDVLADLEDRIQQLEARVEVGPLPALDGDGTQMRQLLQNLIGNALKFHRPETPPEVSVEAGVTPALPPVPSEAEENAGPDWCEIRVRDNGIGFEEQYLDRIFQVFQRLHGRGEYEGTGVGLAICRKIAERHGGSITARSTPGEGTTFLVRLPVRQAVATGGPPVRLAVPLTAGTPEDGRSCSP